MYARVLAQRHGSSVVVVLWGCAVVVGGAAVVQIVVASAVVGYVYRTRPTRMLNVLPFRITLLNCELPHALDALSATSSACHTTTEAWLQVHNVRCTWSRKTLVPTALWTLLS